MKAVVGSNMMMYWTKKLTILLLALAAVSLVQDPAVAQVTPSELSKYMNSVPPSEAYLAVGNGPTNLALHPDRAPHTQLAEQDGVILFSGAAPQLGLNFELSAGALVYRNQMSTLGSAEPSPQVGTAGSLLQRGDERWYPWTEARWHPGEDITWQGYRYSADWLEGLPHFEYVGVGQIDVIAEVCEGNVEDREGDIYRPELSDHYNGGGWSLKSSFNLQLSRGIYQMSRVRSGFYNTTDTCPFTFREPWFQGRGRKASFAVRLDTNGDGQINSSDYRIADQYYPTYQNVYTYEELELNAGNLTLEFEPSATWPRQGKTSSGIGGDLAGMEMAETARDQYGNRVAFERFPAYGWENDYKTPHKASYAESDPAFDDLSELYRPVPNSWRLPHKRLRSVKLFDAESLAGSKVPDWTVVFVHEHPESDRITGRDVMRPVSELDDEPDRSDWKSIYSHLPQSDWEDGRLPDLADETTLLTVQAYKGDVDVNGRSFQDDWSVWGNVIYEGEGVVDDDRLRLNSGRELPGDANGDGCPGVCGVDDDGDGEIDEGDPADDDENGVVDYLIGSTRHGVPQVFTGTNGNKATDPPGDGNDDGCPGRCDVDDDGDGLIDEDSNGNMAYVIPIMSCSSCQQAIAENDDIAAYCMTRDGEFVQSHVGTCKNPLYWRPDGHGGYLDEKHDIFSHYDDDEDGLVDEDGWDDPLLVNLRWLDDDGTGNGCASGKHPFMPADALPAGMDDDITTECRTPYAAPSDNWVYQVQYVYSRSNPYWLMLDRDENGKTILRDKPAYYYYPPFTADFNGDGERSVIVDASGNGGCAGDNVCEPDMTGELEVFGLDTGGRPHVHPDCVPSPAYRGVQGKVKKHSGSDWADPVPPGEVHLIKRIVRVRDTESPNSIIEQVWLYRYNDFGFLKAVFEPADVEAILMADSDLDEPDDILQLADIELVGDGADAKPLIMYASQWYTYYHPYVYQKGIDIEVEIPGIQPCYDQPPFVGACSAFLQTDDPRRYLPTNGCDGEYLWTDEYTEELAIDNDCSDFMRHDCGWCFARWGCGSTSSAFCSDNPMCTCVGGVADDENQLAQLGIPGAQPRFRKFQVKTARVRGSDGNVHMYQFDYLGAANSAYTDDGVITSYADPHNITIVDELVEQTPDEFAADADDYTVRNEFYIYENDFRLTLDPPNPLLADAGLPDPDTDVGPYDITTHFMYVPSKVKTRRVVTMNYYGIAISDRLILTPGFVGDQTSFVDSQQYELTNTRGQTKHIFDQSWVATLQTAMGPEMDVTAALAAVADKGRVLAQLFGGEGGWHTVLRGIAWGSSGGNLYDQQCRTPDILADVPVQRVENEDVRVLSVTEHFPRVAQVDGLGEEVVSKDMPLTEVVFYDEVKESQLATFGITVEDPAYTLGAYACAEDCDDNCLGDLNLHNQEPVTVDMEGLSDTEADGMAVIRYDYEFYGDDPTTPEESVKWKYRWQEAVSPSRGGTGSIALEVWHFDVNGLLRLYGRGSGNDTENPPAPAEPFIWTYYGYDDYGRQVITVEDIDPAQMGDHFDGDLEWNGMTVIEIGGPLNDFTPAGDREFANRITVNKYNDFGAITSTCTGQSDASGGFNFNLTGSNDELVRTDFAILKRNITATVNSSNGEGTAVVPVWEDPYIYHVTYQHVDDEGSSVDQVYGTTTVTMTDHAGRFVEQRTITWDPSRATTDGVNPTDKVEDFGWGISLKDYEFDNAIDGWAEINMPDGVWDTCVVPGYYDCDDGSGMGDGYYDFVGDLNPEFPGDQPTELEDEDAGVWPPAQHDRIVTLARSFKQYGQASTLKPTQDVVFRSFEEPDTGEDIRTVVRHYAYDLEDRIARTQDPDGTVQRYLFDAKRRPTKVFRGSADGCLDWFPYNYGGGSADDMLLIEQRLYNDGDASKEWTTTFEFEEASLGGTNDNFPNNAGRLVRARSFTDTAETCSTAFDQDTPSRDMKYLYDWRGRPVVTLDVAVGYDGGTVFLPAVIGATSTVYDNLDRPRLVATWAAGDEPTVETIDDASGSGWYYNACADADDDYASAVAGMLAAGPLSLTAYFYDDRGRQYETRSYNVGEVDGSDFVSTRTYRDDLNRVTAEVSPSGLVEYTYDGLGRTIATSHWSQGTASGEPAGVELTRSKTTYDSFGNVVQQVSIERKDLNDASVAELTDSECTDNCNSIVTTTCNWYDQAQRLSATASFGTGDGSVSVGDGFPDVPAQVLCDAEVPPVWVSDGSGSRYEIGATQTHAIVSQFGYDAAGRRVWSRDPLGRVARTWYDLLGNTLLEADNWHDDDETFGPPDVGGDGANDLTPDHSGPTRYTAYHYTRGGLLDMIVAVLPTSNDPVPDITPASFNWNEDSASDYAAGDVEIAGVSGVTLQATRFRYDGEVVAERIESGSRTKISTGANLIAAIEYPDSDSTNAIDDGLPSDTDKLTFRYTPSGQVAQRTDQRGITLDFAYGEYDTAVCNGDCPPLSALTSVYVTDADPANSGVDLSVDQLAFAYDARGQLTKAATLNGGVIKSQVAWVYDSLGNLTSETLDPTDDGNYVKSVNYSWEETTDSLGAGTGQYRLSQIGYPSGLDVEFNYGASGSVSDVVSRVLGYDVGGEALYRNSFTAGGQVTGRSWHDPAASGATRITQSWIAGSGGTPSDGMRDQFGRPLHLHYKNGGNTLVHYEYGHDAAGNRHFARATQAGHDNDRSFLYRYDELDRLTLAEHGELDSGNDGFVTTSVIPLAKEWKLDILGNWSGGEIGLDSVVMFADDDGSLSYDSGVDSNYTTVHHAVNEVNEITGIHVDGGATQPFAYDDAGSLISDNERHFVYDAWNRLVTVTDDATPTPNVLAEYSYDALGRRIRKQVSNSGGWNTSGDGQFYYYDGNRIIEEDADDAAGSGTGPDVVSRFVWGIGYIDEGVAQFTGAEDAQNPNGELQFLITDANYNVAAVVDDGGALVQQYAYYPYGKRLAVEDSSGDPVNYTSSPSLRQTAIGHQGLFHDEEIELIYNRARHLSPELGRFVQRDPLATALVPGDSLTIASRGSIGSLAVGAFSRDLYCYERSTPLSLSDPSGLTSAGVNHWVPLYLGGRAAGPGTWLDHAQHNAFDTFLHREFGGQYSKFNLAAR